MLIPRRIYQLPLHSLSKNQPIVNNHSKIGMNKLSQRAKLNSLSIISQDLGDIPQISLKLTT